MLEDYYEMDGYSLFYEAIQSLQIEGQLTPIHNNQYNGKTPSLPLYYWVNVKAQADKWDRLEMMKLSDLFDFSFYERYPEWQTKEEWRRIQNLYAFLQSSQEREIVSLEERSLELFNHEKFLIDGVSFPDGKGFWLELAYQKSSLKW